MSQPGFALAAPATRQPTEPGRGPAVARLEAFDTGERRLLAHLRDLARHAQLSGPIALDGACRLAEAPLLRQADAYGSALLRYLGIVAARPLVFHPRGAVEVGFDEAWLMRLVRCLAHGDEDSARVLICGRILPVGRRVVAFLAKGFAERLAVDAP